jgi:hypothetical protein
MYEIHGTGLLKEFLSGFMGRLNVRGSWKGFLVKSLWKGFREGVHVRGLWTGFMETVYERCS